MAVQGRRAAGHADRRLAGDLAVPDTGSAVEDTRRYLRALARFITEDPAGKVLLALIGEAQHDAEMAQVFHARYLDPQREAERAMLARGVASGELADGLDLDRALDALLGPLFYRAMLTGGPISPVVTDQLVADVLGAAAARATVTHHRQQRGRAGSARRVAG